MSSFPSNQEQFGDGFCSTHHSARQREVYSAVGYHQVCVSCSVGKLLTEFLNFPYI